MLLLCGLCFVVLVLVFFLYLVHCLLSCVSFPYRVSVSCLLFMFVSCCFVSYFLFIYCPLLFDVNVLFGVVISFWFVLLCVSLWCCALFPFSFHVCCLFLFLLLLLCFVLFSLLYDCVFLLFKCTLLLS